MDVELRGVARRDTNSMLQNRSFDMLSNFSYEQIAEELKTMCPVTYNLLAGMLDLENYSEKKIAALSLIYGVIMFKRCKELSFIQRINTIILSDSGANTEVG